jgi:hypothetical protein
MPGCKQPGQSKLTTRLLEQTRLATRSRARSSGSMTRRAGKANAVTRINRVGAFSGGTAVAEATSLYLRFEGNIAGQDSTR